MKNICITKSNNKFNNNIIAYQQDIRFLEIDYPEINIYKHYYLHNKDIQKYIINASKMSEEIISFIQEFNEIIDFIIYFDIISEELYKLLSPIIKKSIVDHNIDLQDSIKLPQYIINDILYTDMVPCDKIDQMVYFIDKDTEIPLGLQSALYPNTNLKIKMFNSIHVKHPQNLGLINELDKKNILNESSVYCYSNTDYIAEALVCGCKALDVSESFNLEEAYYPKIEYTTYGKFLKDNIL